MSKSLKLGAALLCLTMALPLLAAPTGQVPKKSTKHGRGKLIPARHNAGRPTHA